MSEVLLEVEQSKLTFPEPEFLLELKVIVAKVPLPDPELVVAEKKDPLRIICPEL